MNTNGADRNLLRLEDLSLATQHIVRLNSSDDPSLLKNDDDDDSVILEYITTSRSVLVLLLVFSDSTKADDNEI